MKTNTQKPVSRLTLHISLLLLALCPMPYALGQQTIYVDVSNNTGNENGTQEYPFNTILEGLQFSQNRDSIFIMPGNYPEDSILIEKCVSIAGGSSLSTLVEGTFILSSRLDTLPVLIRNLWCHNIMHSDSGYTQTPLEITDCGLQVLNDYTPSVSETGRILVKNCKAADSIHIQSAACAAKREVINCETEGGLWVGSPSSNGTIRIEGNQVAGSLIVSTVSKSDTNFITGNTISDSLVILSTASDPDLISNNQVGGGIRMHAVAHSGFRFTGNQVQQGSLSAKYTALDESVMENNTFLNGGIDFKAVSGHIIITGNSITSDGTNCGIRLQTVAGGEINDNTITLPYLPATGQPFETDTNAVSGVNIHATSFGGMAGNQIKGGTYGVYLSAIASNDFNKNKIEDSHFGVYLRSVSAYVDSNRVEYCIGDGMILDYQAEHGDTNSIRLNYNIVRNNGGHGIWTKGNCPMGRMDEPGTGYNIFKDNGGYDLYVETSATFVDTIWAQNNEWSHSTEEEIGLIDIFDKFDDPMKALVYFTPVLPFGVKEQGGGDEEKRGSVEVFPNPTHGKFQITSTKHQANDKFQAPSTKFQTNSKKQIQNIEVVDLYGKVVIDSPLHRMGEGPGVGAGAMEIDISHCPAGIYFVRISIGNEWIVKKIVKL